METSPRISPISSLYSVTRSATPVEAALARTTRGLEIGELDFDPVKGAETTEDEKLDDDRNKGFEHVGETEERRS